MPSIDIEKLVNHSHRIVQNHPITAVETINLDRQIEGRKVTWRSLKYPLVKGTRANIPLHRGLKDPDMTSFNYLRQGLLNAMTSIQTQLYMLHP